MTAFKELRSVATIVFVNTKVKTNWSSLPKSAQTGLRHKDAGKYIPKVAITDSQAKQHLLSIRYEDWKEGSKAMRRVDNYFEAIEQKKADELEKELAKKRKFYSWKNFEGKVIQAQFVQLADQTVTIKLRSGKTVNYALDKLNTESQELAKSLKD